MQLRNIPNTNNQNYTATDIINSGKSALSQVRDGNIVVASFRWRKSDGFSVLTDEPAVLSASGTDNKTLQFMADKELQVHAAQENNIRDW